MSYEHFFDSPQYIKLKEYNIDLVLITHDMLADKNLEKKKEFITLIESVDHVLFENTRANALYYEEREPLTFESLAHKISKTKSYFLEDHDDIAELSAQYGLRKDLHWVYNCLHWMPGMSKWKKERSELRDDLDLHFSLIEVMRLGSSKVDVDDCVDKYLTIFDYFSDSLEDVAQCGYRTTFYRASVRDYEVLGPRIVDYMKNNDGTFAALFGMSHIGGIYDYITKGTCQVPQNWLEFVTTLKSEEQQIIHTIENELFPLP